MFIDKVEITIKAGNGGNGSTSFLRDRMTMHGGPDGGDGGKGGDIIFVGTTNVDNLIDFRYVKKYFAGDGENGRPGNKNGASGKDLKVFLPLGTKIFKSISPDTANQTQLLADLTLDGQEYRALRGGAGGRGNAHFATARRQTPNFSQTGIKTAPYKVLLELNCLADIGIIGFPNVGKSTLLSVVTRANPKIANYHFTTLHPNIGVYSNISNGGNIILADIPGLIEGAHQGIGLGTDFLKHVTRTRLLLHIIDISEQEDRDAINDFEIINKELVAFSEALSQKPQIIVLNKTEIADQKRIALFKKTYEKKYKIFEISAVTRQGINELMNYAAVEIAKLPKIKPEIHTAELETRTDKNLFEIVIEGKNSFRVIGPLIDNLIRGIVLSDTESNSYFQRRLGESGVIDALKNAGMKDGDMVKIADTEFIWTD